MGRRKKSLEDILGLFSDKELDLLVHLAKASEEYSVEVMSVYGASTAKQILQTVDQIYIGDSRTPGLRQSIDTLYSTDCDLLLSELRLNHKQYSLSDRTEDFEHLLF